VNDVFKEVEESLREETLAQWWKRWSFLIYGAGRCGRHRRRRVPNSCVPSAPTPSIAPPLHTMPDFVALQSGDLATARARFSELSSSDTGFAVLAGNMLARVERDLTNDPAAIEAHLKKAAATDKGVLGDPFHFSSSAISRPIRRHFLSLRPR